MCSDLSTVAIVNLGADWFFRVDRVGIDPTAV
jgi:hypothetical protein